MNLALGAKILWRIVSGESGWWKEILRRKKIYERRKEKMHV